LDKLEKYSQLERAALQLDALIQTEADKLSAGDRPEPELPTASPGSDVFFTTSVLGMNAISHVIEDQAMTMGQAVRFYASFQKFSRVQPQQARYRQLLAAHIPVYLFGIADAPLWEDPCLKPVTLSSPTRPGQPSLTHNWFVVLNNPQFVSMALVGRELPNSTKPLHAPDKLLYRNFEGFWTYDKAVIGQVVEILDDYIKRRNV